MNTPTESSLRESTYARKARPTAIVALAAVGSIALLGCSRGESKASAPASHLVRVVTIDTTQPTSAAANNYTGVVRARFESNLGFRVAGKVAERLVNAGDAVIKGQPLLKLDPADY